MMCMSGADDGALVAAFRAGQGEAFEAIVRRHYQGLLRVAEQRCGHGALAEDAVQTALIRAHRYLRSNNSVHNLGAWLRRVVYNCATDLLKSERRDRVGLDLVSDVAAPPDRSDERTELRRLVADGIEKLPKIYRRPLVMRYLYGIDTTEIAIRLNENLNTIKSQIARGRRELRRRLERVLMRGGYL